MRHFLLQGRLKIALIVRGESREKRRLGDDIAVSGDRQCFGNFGGNQDLPIARLQGTVRIILALGSQGFNGEQRGCAQERRPAQKGASADSFLRMLDRVVHNSRVLIL